MLSVSENYRANISYTETASQGYQAKFTQLNLPQGEIDVNELVEQAELWK